MESAAPSTSITSKYVRDFESLFVPIRISQLRDKARSGNLRFCQFRSLCWRYFLHCLPGQYDQWPESCAKSRRRYEHVKRKHSAAQQLDDQQSTTATTTVTANYLSDDNKNQPSLLDETAATTTTTTTTTATSGPATVANKHNKELEEEQRYMKAANQCDHKNVVRTIERDVVRTFPDMEFFRQTEIQAILGNVLFNFASENPNLSYKQGMHELLATLLYVLHTDSQNCLINYQGGYANETIATLLDLKYLEHDVFHLFCALMKSIEAWYQNDEILMVPDSNNTPQNKRENGGLINRSSNRGQVNSVLGIKLKMISENIVKNYDIELFNHLEALQIAPQIYGIRWMRLLFGREFEFLDLLTVWDAIICDQVSMSLTDFIFASMLITIREELVNGDYTDCLNNLMRHQFKDVQYVIKLALHLRDPQNNPRPKAPKSSLLSSSSSGIQKQLRGGSSGSPTMLQRNRISPETSLTSKLRQQYISGKQQIRQQANNRTNPLFSSSSSSTNNQFSQRVIKEYEMREMAASSSASPQASARRFPISSIGGGSSSSRNPPLNLSTESYDDLHSIVDYCWRLLSEQIDSLQRCLPKEKSLHSEDEIFVALAQLKKVRDVLKGSLRLEDELESLALGGGGGKS